MTKHLDPECLWRQVYALFEPMQPDEVLSYDAIGAVLGTDDRDKIRRHVRRAKRQMWAELGRSVTAVSGVGYRMLRANEHADQAREYERAGKHLIGFSVAVVDCVRLDELTDAEREHAVSEQIRLARVRMAFESSRRRSAYHDELARRVVSRAPSLVGAIDQV